MRLKKRTAMGAAVVFGVSLTDAAPAAAASTTTTTSLMEDSNTPNTFIPTLTTPTTTSSNTTTFFHPTGPAALTAFQNYSANGYSACSVLPTPNTDYTRHCFTKPLSTETVLVSRMYCDGGGWCLNPVERGAKWRERVRWERLGRVVCEETGVPVVEEVDTEVGEGEEIEEEDTVKLEERYGYPTGSFTWEESYPNVWKTKTKGGISPPAAITTSTSSSDIAFKSSFRKSASLQPRLCGKKGCIRVGGEIPPTTATLDRMTSFPSAASAPTSFLEKLNRRIGKMARPDDSKLDPGELNTTRINDPELHINMTMPDYPQASRRGDNGCLFLDDEDFWREWKIWSEKHGALEEGMWKNICRGEDGMPIRGITPWTYVNPGTVTFTHTEATVRSTPPARFSSITKSTTIFEGFSSREDPSTTSITPVSLASSAKPSYFSSATILEVPNPDKVPLPSVLGPNGCLFVDDEQFWKDKEVYDQHHEIQAEIPKFCLTEGGQPIRGFGSNTYIWSATSLTSTLTGKDKTAIPTSFSRVWENHDMPMPFATGPGGCLCKDDHEYFYAMNAWNKAHEVTTQEIGELCKDEDGNEIFGLPTNTLVVSATTTSSKGSSATTSTASGGTTTTSTSSGASTPTATSSSAVKMKRSPLEMPVEYLGYPVPKARGPNRCVYADDKEFRDAKFVWEQTHPPMYDYFTSWESIICRGENGRPLRGFPPNTWEEEPTKTLSSRGDMEPRPEPFVYGPDWCVYIDDKEYHRALGEWKERYRIRGGFGTREMCYGENGGYIRGLPPNTWEEEPMFFSWSTATPASTSTSTSTTLSTATSSANILPRGPRGPNGCIYPDDKEALDKLAAWAKAHDLACAYPFVCDSLMPKNTTSTSDAPTTTTSTSSTSLSVGSIPTKILPRGRHGPGGCIYPDDKVTLDELKVWQSAHTGNPIMKPNFCKFPRPVNRPTNTTSTPNLSRRQLLNIFATDLSDPSFFGNPFLKKAQEIATSGVASSTPVEKAQETATAGATSTTAPGSPEATFIAAPELLKKPEPNVRGPGGCRYADDRAYWEALAHYYRVTGFPSAKVADLCQDEKGREIYGLPPHTSLEFPFDWKKPVTLTSQVSTPASFVPTITTTEEALPRFSSQSFNGRLSDMVNQRVNVGLPKQTSGFETQKRTPLIDIVNQRVHEGLPGVTTTAEPALQRRQWPQTFESARSTHSTSVSFTKPGCYGSRCPSIPTKIPASVGRAGLVSGVYAYVASQSVYAASINSIISEEKKWGPHGVPSLVTITPPPATPTNDLFLGIATHADESLILTYIDVCAQIYTLKESLSRPNVDTTSLLAKESHLRSSSSVLLSQLGVPKETATAATNKTFPAGQQGEGLSSAMERQSTGVHLTGSTSPYWWLSSERPTVMETASRAPVEWEWNGGMYEWGIYEQGMAEAWRTKTWGDYEQKRRRGLDGYKATATETGTVMTTTTEMVTPTV